MAFRIVKQAQAWWPVEWDGVAEDGTIVTNKIELRFNLLKIDDVTEIEREVMHTRDREREELARAAESGGRTKLSDIYAELVERIATDWRGVEAENGEPLPWKRETLSMLMNEPGLFSHVFEAFRGCLSGRREIREGN